MVSSAALTVEQYLMELDEPRKSEITEILNLLRKSLPEGFDEVMAWGMIVFQVPFSVSGPTYNNQPLAAVALASQRNYISVYLTSVYASEQLTEEFRQRWSRNGKKLDMGKSCVRFKYLEDADLDTIAWAVSLFDPKQIVEQYLAARTANSIKKLPG